MARRRFHDDDRDEPAPRRPVGGLPAGMALAAMGAAGVAAVAVALFVFAARRDQQTARQRADEARAADRAEVERSAVAVAPQPHSSPEPVPELAPPPRPARGGRKPSI